MKTMRRFLATTVTISALSLAAASPASALVTELGPALDTLTPSCPTSPCLAVTRTTGFQFTAGTRRNVFVVPRDGRIVAFTLKLGSPTAKQTQFFDQQSGGEAQAQVAILKPKSTKTVAKDFKYVLNALSDPFKLKPFFGSVVQFPLYTSLLVRKGWVVAMNFPTWAPALAVNGLDNTNSWRASRVAPCSTNAEAQDPHSTPGSVKTYFCTYRPARLAYTATLVSTPVPKKK
jgi:hypothetical protein